MNSIQTLPFNQITQDAMLMCPTVATAAPSGIIGTIDYWQTITGAVIVATMAVRRQHSIAATGLLPEPRSKMARHPRSGDRRMFPWP
jgi:hypothetical protein